MEGTCRRSSILNAEIVVELLTLIESVERLLKMLFHNVLVSVAPLLAVFGSVTRLGVVTVAVFEIEPLAEAPMVPVAL